MNLSLIRDTIVCREKCLCRDVVDSNLHCHIITKAGVKKAIQKLKSNKIDEGCILFSNNFIHGTDLLFLNLSMLFNSMIDHGFAPDSFLQSSIVPIPKGARANVSDSNMYRSIAISSLLNKIFDNIIIERQSLVLSTSNNQFGFKSKSSTVLCSTMVIETIQYYLERNAQSVYLVLLDASKAFDRVSYDRLFNVLLERNMCPRIVRLLYYMYTHQQYYVKWNNERSNLFNLSNGVKQGSVISPLLFSIYIDELFSKLEYLGLGCHVGLTYAGAFGYADDIALISPTIYGLKNMLKVCELFAVDNDITFNPIKSKLIFYNIDSSTCPPIYLNSQPITIVNSDKHLGNFSSSDIQYRNVISSVCDLYQRSNSIIYDFSSCNSVSLDSLHNTLCMHMYGCELWNLSNGQDEKFKIAWRKVKRRIWKLPRLTNNCITHGLSTDISALIEKRMINFIHNALNRNSVCKNVLYTKLRCKHSYFAENFRYLSYKYELCLSEWENDVSFLMGKVKMKLNTLYLSIICTYTLSLSVSSNPLFHTCLPTSLILLQMCFFQYFPFTFIPNFTIPFKLTSLNQIRFTNSKSPNLLHICLHRDQHIDLHPNSIKHALPISDTRFSSNTTFNIHFTIDFASLSSKVLHPVSPLISSFPTSQSHRPIPFCRISKSSHSF